MKKEDFKIHCPPVSPYDAVLKSPRAVREISSDMSEEKEKKPEESKVQPQTSDKELIFANLHLKERLRNASVAFAEYARLHAEKPPSPENSGKVLRNVLLQRHCDPDVTQSDAEEALMKYLMRNL